MNTGTDPVQCTHKYAAAFKALAVKFDFSRYSSLLDVGGSAASLSCTLAAAHPHLRAVSADLPAVRGAAEASIAAAGLQGRVAAAELDFFSGDAFPKADVVTMSMILHDWGTSNKIMLMKKVRGGWATRRRAAIPELRQALRPVKLPGTCALTTPARKCRRLQRYPLAAPSLRWT